MRFTKAALWLLASSIASTITTNAFQAPTSSSSSSLLLLPSRSISLLQQQQQSNGDDDTVGSSTNQQQQQQQQQQQNKRKPRFAQDAHARSSGTVRPKVAAAAAAAAVVRQQQQQQQQLANNGNDSWQDTVPRTKAPQTQTPQSNNRGSAPSTKSPPRKPLRVFTGTFDDDDDNDDNHYDNRTNNNNGNSNSEIQNDFMWKTGKSIDDLENSMTSRFGTNQQQWAADPSEYELEDATTAASNFGRKTNNNNSDNIKNPTVSKSGKFNGKPVLDPWQRQEQTKKRSKKEKFEAETTAAAAPSSMFDVKSDEGYILNRARRNQQPKSEENRKRRPKWADLVDEFDDTGSNDSTDFYDEDDEGYEAPGRNDNDVGKLISHKPVGGRGTFKATTTSSSSSSGTRPVPKPQDASPGYFFNANAVREEAADEDAAAAAKKPPRKRIRIPPMMDDNDNAIYLTTEQADRNFKAALKASGVNDLDDDDNNNNSDTEEEPTAWNELGITSERLLTNLETMGCPSPLSVQEKSCASILTGNDVLVGTYTGSGKTLAFLVPLVQQLLLDDQTADGLAILVVAPGRELASQITSVARSLLEGTGLSVVLAIGGTTFSRNLEQIRKKKPTIVVGTPGRIAELVVGQPGQKGGRMKIASLQSIVLDEFDALLEYKPHRDPTAAIMAALKRRHRDSLQSILCSATATDMAGSAQLNSYLRPGYTTAMADVDDRLITAGDEKNAVTRVSRTVMHGVVHVSRQQLALDTIRKVLHTEPVPQQVLIFADNARRVDLVVEKLAQMDIIAAALHGGAKSEKMDRAEVSKALREGYVGIVVATELAARGLDAPLLTHVINLDLPTDASHYAHRAGRCGRGGRPGVVVNITTEPKQRNVPKKFADKLGVDMFAVEPRAGKLLVLEAAAVSTTNDPSP